MAFFSKSKSSSSDSSSKDFGPKFLLEYSMGQYDYERYHQLLIMADFLADQVLNKNVHAIKPLYSKLVTIYSNFRPVVYQSYRGKYETLQKDCERLITEWGKKGYAEGKNLFPVSLVNKLIEFWQELLVLKQLIGLGSIVKKDESKKTKLDRAAGLTD